MLDPASVEPVAFSDLKTNTVYRIVDPEGAVAALVKKDEEGFLCPYVIGSGFVQTSTISFADLVGDGKLNEVPRVEETRVIREFAGLGPLPAPSGSMPSGFRDKDGEE